MKKILLTVLWLGCAAVIAAGEKIRIIDATERGGEPFRMLALGYGLKHDAEIRIEKKRPAAALQELFHKRADFILLERRQLPRQQYFPVRFYATMVLAAYLPLNNPLNNLSAAQFRDLMVGEQLDWAKFTPTYSGTLQRCFLRPDSTGGTLAEALLGVKNLSREALRLESTAEAIMLTQGNPAGVAVGLLLPEVPAQVKVLAVDGITPELKNVAQGRYKWAEIYSVMQQPKLSPAAQKFLQALQGRDFRDAIYDAGMFPVR